MADSYHDTGVSLIPVTSRATHVSKQEWWSIDGDVGANTLLRRVMREHSWSQAYAERVLKAYQQFMALKKVLEDWDATIVAPSMAGECCLLRIESDEKEREKRDVGRLYF